MFSNKVFAFTNRRLGYIVDLEERRGKDEQRVDEGLHLWIYKVNHVAHEILKNCRQTLDIVMYLAATHLYTVSTQHNYQDSPFSRLKAQKKNTLTVAMSYSTLYNNQINARALIGQSAMVYCASKPMEKLRVLRIII